MTMNYVPNPAPEQPIPQPVDPPPPIPSLVSPPKLETQSTEHLSRVAAMTSSHPINNAIQERAKAELARRGAKPIASAKPAAKPIAKTLAPMKALATKAATKGTTMMHTRKQFRNDTEARAYLRKTADDPNAPAAQRKEAGDALAKLGERLPFDQHQEMLKSMGIREQPKGGVTTKRPDGSVEFRRILPSEARRSAGGAA